MEWMANETDPMAKELKRQFDEYLGELGLHEASTWDKYEGTLYQAARDWFGVDRGRRPMKEWLDEECWAAVQAKMSAADRYAWWDDKRRVRVSWVTCAGWWRAWARYRGAKRAAKAICRRARARFQAEMIAAAEAEWRMARPAEAWSFLHRATAGKTGKFAKRKRVPPTVHVTTEDWTRYLCSDPPLGAGYMQATPHQGSRGAVERPEGEITRSEFGRAVTC